MPRLQAANLCRTTLAEDCSSSATSITVASSTGFPPCPFRIFVGTNTNYEIMEVTSVSGNQWTVIRAQEGTTAQFWPAGTVVENRFTAGTYDELVSGPSSSEDNLVVVFDGTSGRLIKSPTIAKAPNNTQYTTGQIRNIFLSTSDPSTQGGEGDIWIKYQG